MGKSPLNFCRAVSRYVSLHLLKEGYLISRKSQSGRDREVIVSLSTLPGRINQLYPTLKSLLAQTVRPDRININVPSFSRREQKPYHVPDRLRNFPLVNIVDCDEDYGPATKSIPTLKAEKVNPEALVIIVDDDQIYPRTLIETYLKEEAAHPDAALCLTGWRVPGDLDHEKRHNVFGNLVDEPYAVDIMQGASSYLIKPRFFDDGLYDYTGAPRESFFVDDIWISGHLARHGVPRLVVPIDCHWVRMVRISSLRTLRLSRSENLDGQNNRALYEHFREYWSGGRAS